MKGKTRLLLFVFTAALCSPGIHSRGLNSVAERLCSLKDYVSAAEVNVQLPQGADVNYILNIHTTATDSISDPLSNQDYMIEWEIPENGDSKGFTAYFKGNLFRYGDGRLTEYHFEWDSIPFTLGKSAVQHNAQFIGYTPARIGELMQEIAGDSSGEWKYTFSPDSVFGGVPADVLLAEYSRNGYLGKRVTIVTHPATSAPIYYESENNPTSISEQIITVKYSGTATDPFPVSAEQDLIAMYPEVFENFRESNFSVETLRGRALPTFSLPTATGERYSYTKGDGFRAPAIIVFIDPATSHAAETVRDVRSGADMLPGNCVIIYASVTTDVDAAESLVPELRANESLLVSGKSLARDCGVTSFPTLLFTDKGGIVRDVTIGFNNNIPDVVIEKTVK